MSLIKCTKLERFPHEKNTAGGSIYSWQGSLASQGKLARFHINYYYIMAFRKTLNVLSIIFLWHLFKYERLFYHLPQYKITVPKCNVKVGYYQLTKQVLLKYLRFLAPPLRIQKRSRSCDKWLWKELRSPQQRMPMACSCYEEAEEAYWDSQLKTKWLETNKTQLESIFLILHWGGMKELSYHITNKHPDM